MSSFDTTVEAADAAAAASAAAQECECCGLTEECTAPYAASVRARYGGRWICGLCGGAVENELGRASPPISTEEALARHTDFCFSHRSSGPPSPVESADHFIAAVRKLLQRRLGAPRNARSLPSSPGRDGGPLSASSHVATASSGGALARTESCFPALAGLADYDR